MTRPEDIEAIVEEAERRIQPVLDVIANALMEREVERIIAERQGPVT
jgi:hypothetical protein